MSAATETSGIIIIKKKKTETKNKQRLITAEEPAGS